MNPILAVFYRDYRQRITNIAWMFWDLFVPVAYLMLFGMGFERAFEKPVDLQGLEVGYASFLLPGVLAMTTFGIAMNTSWSFFMDKDSGIFYELLTYPFTRRQFLVGKICFNVMLSLIGSFLVIFLGAQVLGVDVRWPYLPFTSATIIVTTAGWFFLFSIFAIRLRRMDAFNTFTSAAYIILMFISSMFYPISDLPGWFRWIAQINPMTWQVDVLRFSVLGVGSITDILMETAAFCGFTMICLTFAVREMNRAS